MQATRIRGWRHLAAALLLTVTPALAQHAAAQQFWTGLVNTTATASTIEKTAGCGTCPDAGGRSVAEISAAGGHAEFTPSYGHRFYAGLGNDTTSGTDATQIDFAFSFWAGGTWDIRESGVYRAEGAYAAGDIFKVAVESDVVKYYKNGALVYTSATAPTYPLVLDTTMISLGSRVENAGVSGGSSTTDVIWVSTVNTAAAGSTLQKTGGCDGCPDAGAISQQQISSGNGHFQFTPSHGHRQYAGLGTDTTSSTDASRIDFGFSFWPGGTYDVRESGIYRAEGSHAAGDVFKVAIESGAVKYYRNGNLVFTSALAPSYPLVADTTMLSSASSLSACTIASGTGGGGPPPTYSALSDRNVRTKPALPAFGDAGTAIIDPRFGSRLTRITDTDTRPASPNLSYRTPSAGHQNAWNTTGRYFYVVSTDGTVVPFSFDSATGAAARLQPSPTGEGGLILSFRGEPQFSYAREHAIYGNYSGPGSTLRQIYQYDFSANSYTPLVNLDDVVPGLGGTYVGGIGSSSGPVEKITVFFGGIQQDYHHYVLVFDRDNPGNRTLVDTLASTIDGVPTNVTLDFRLHHAYIDRSGRYVMLSPTSGDRQPPRSAAPLYLWDLTTDNITAVSTLVGGHDAVAFGQMVNQDCCTTTTWDAAQWQLRSLATPAATRDLIVPVLLPKEVYLADHTSWHNAQPGTPLPFITATYRYGNNTVEWRAWDDEVVAIQTDVPPGSGATVWRFAHHRSAVANDVDASRIYFWYTPRPNVSHDGRWALFTSNWEKTLGTDPRGETGGQYRQDVFVVRLQ